MRLDDSSADDGTVDVPIPPDLDRVIDRYIAGEATASEANQLLQWVNARSVRRRELDTLYTFVQQTRPATSSANIGDVLQTLRERRADVDGKSRQPEGARVGAKKSVFLLRVFMSGLAAMALGGVLLHRINQTSNTVSRYVAGPGQRATLRLADGSTMMLAPATTLTIRRNEVTVSGEAYFRITSHADRGLVVHTRNAVVQVLGTRFAVRQYPSEPASQVFVEDGKVMLRVQRVSRQGTPHILSPAMLAQATDSSITITSDLGASDYLSWTRGKLVFNEVPLRDVLAELAKMYDADIKVSDTILAQKPMIIEVAIANRSLARILDLIGTAADAHYTHEGRTYRLIPGRIIQQPPQRRQFPQLERDYGR